MASKILSCYPDINKEWILTGEGPMLKTDAAAPAQEKPESAAPAASPPPERRHTVRYYPGVDASLGGVEFADTPDESEAVPLVVPGFDDCDVAINAFGESMRPVIHSGQIVLLHRWQESFIEWGKIYLVITRTGHRTIKRLYPAPTDPEAVEARSDNPDYAPFLIPRTDILRLFLVKGWITRDSI